jgi:pSer/pThr/pTyr-binding forkhead associated (FHA) protein
MKVSLIVKSPGKMLNKAIPVPGSQFLIGRDPQCQLRPSSPLISNRHCALLIRGDRLFIRDLVSTNGTCVNDFRIDGEVELRPNDVILVGPLKFAVAIERPAPVKVPVSQDDELAATLLLSLADDTAPAPRSEAPTATDLLAGTVEHGVAPPDGSAPAAETQPEEQTKLEKIKQSQADTSIAASAILSKYLRRR